MAAESETRVAVVSKRGRFTVCEPIFERGGRSTISGGPKVESGRMALVRMLRGDRAQVIRPLGDPERAADVVEALLADRGIERGFSPEIEAEASRSAADARARASNEGRKDLRDLPTFTVDPATARDFDDAVSARAEGDDIRLWIHIADVAAHVRPGSGLEAEAHRRANSVYVPGFVEPMLPHALSSEACSLAPEVERLAVTAEILLSPQGEPRSAAFYRSLIRSDARLEYDQLDRIFAGSERPPEIAAEPLRLARTAAAALFDTRPPDALDVTTSEPEFEFDDGRVVAAHSSYQTEAHRLIEQLMILANEQVAELLDEKSVPTLYRVHEEPDPARVELLVVQLDALDLPTPPVPEHMTPAQAGEVVGQASRLVAKEARRRGHGLEAYTSLVLRSLKQAYYADANLGHAGLASTAYCHFTSPIRRFPDLLVHRGLLSVVAGDPDSGGEVAPEPKQVAEDGPHCSDVEREAVRIERQADSICAAYLLEREVTENGSDHRYEGEVSGVISAGAFVRFAGEHADCYEGFLPARRIGGRERYDLDDTGTQLVGEGGGAPLRFGDPVEVTVDSVEAPRGRVDLLPAANGGGGAGGRTRSQRGRGAGSRGGKAPTKRGRKPPASGRAKARKSKRSGGSGASRGKSGGKAGSPKRSSSKRAKPAGGSKSKAQGGAKRAKKSGGEKRAASKRRRSSKGRGGAAKKKAR